jgi:RNA recognition motif-containing protein
MDIHISNLSTSFKEGDLKELFSDFGTIKSVSIVRDRFTGESKCFGFVSMPNEEEALEAINQLNNQQIGYRKLEVSKAQPRTNYRLL